LRRDHRCDAEADRSKCETNQAERQCHDARCDQDKTGYPRGIFDRFADAPARGPGMIDRITRCVSYEALLCCFNPPSQTETNIG
jgi:hypothetical protein